MKLPSVMLVRINPSFQYAAMAFLFVLLPYNIITHSVLWLIVDMSAHVSW